MKEHKGIGCIKKLELPPTVSIDEMGQAIYDLSRAAEEYNKKNMGSEISALSEAKKTQSAAQ